jgi:hypothetical protein
MDYKVKLSKCQNEHCHEGVFDIWTKWVKPRLSGPRGWPTQLLYRLARV